jgi:hypothetical protein
MTAGRRGDDEIHRSMADLARRPFTRSSRSRSRWTLRNGRSLLKDRFLNGSDALAVKTVHDEGAWPADGVTNPNVSVRRRRGGDAPPSETGRARAVDGSRDRFAID